MQVDVRPPRGAPESLAELQNYDLFILSNVPATSLSLRQMEVARTYVQDLGGGLMMLGGDQSFGLGGYYKTSLEEILPVRSDFEKEKEKPSLALMLVIDKSGSMGGEKIEMAKEAARAAVELLGPSDKVGVLAFEGENFWISEMHPATDKGFVLDRIASARGRRRNRDGPGDGRSARDAAVDRRQAQARDHPDRRRFVTRRLRGNRPGHDRRPDHLLDRRDGERRRPVAARGNRPAGQRPVVRRRRPRPGAADLRQGDRHRQQVGDQRAAVSADRRPAQPRSSPRSGSTRPRSCSATSSPGPSRPPR